MKNLLIIIATLFTLLSLNAQNIKLPNLSPEMVSQVGYANRASSDFVAARKAHQKGTAMPEGIIKVQPTKATVGSFVKSQSREGKSDMAWIANTNNTFFYKESTGELRYWACLNKVAFSFETVESLANRYGVIDTVEIEVKETVTFIDTVFVPSVETVTQVTHNHYYGDTVKVVLDHSGEPVKSINDMVNAQIPEEAVLNNGKPFFKTVTGKAVKYTAGAVAGYFIVKTIINSLKSNDDEKEDGGTWEPVQD